MRRWVQTYDCIYTASGTRVVSNGPENSSRKKTPPLLKRNLVQQSTLSSLLINLNPILLYLYSVCYSLDRLLALYRNPESFWVPQVKPHSESGAACWDAVVLSASQGLGGQQKCFQVYFRVSGQPLKGNQSSSNVIYPADSCELQRFWMSWRPNRNYSDSYSRCRPGGANDDTRLTPICLAEALGQR